MREEEENFLKYSLYDGFNKIFPCGATSEEIIEKISTGEIKLEIDHKQGSIIYLEDCIDEIRDIIPNLYRIIERPRSFIKSMEEKTPVETAKRINMKAISHLSRDSNDWRSRTFLSVIPKYILSDVNEDTYDLYENRFIKTLIDRILVYVIVKRQNLTELVERLKNEIAITCIEKDLRSEYVRISNGSNDLIKSILSADEVFHGNAFLEDVQGELEKVIELEKKIKVIKRSNLYASLRKVRYVYNPIKKTNIIMFDQNYNKSYRLWNILNAQTLKEDFILEKHDSMQMEKYYFLYCTMATIAAIYNMGFKDVSKTKLYIEDSMTFSSDEFIFQRNKDQLKININDGKELLLSYHVTTLINKWNTIAIKPKFVNFENLTRSDVEDSTTSMINELSINKKNRMNGQYAFVSIDINKCSENNDFGEKIYRRFYNIGDNYSEKEANLNKIANYKTGIIIISPADIRFTLLRIERLLNSHLHISKKMSDFAKNCPICNEKKVKVNSNNEVVCYTCNHIISMSSCVNCKNELLWIKYLDDNAVLREEVVSDLDGKPYYYKLRRYEAVMGSHAITSFLLERETKSGEWKLKTVCPQCGVKLGETAKLR